MVSLRCGWTVLVSSDGTPTRCLGQTFPLTVPPRFEQPLRAGRSCCRCSALTLGSPGLIGTCCLRRQRRSVGSLVACKSTAHYFDPILSMIVDWEERAVVSPWYERVSSVANIADGPSGDDSVIWWLCNGRVSTWQLWLQRLEPGDWGCGELGSPVFCEEFDPLRDAS